MQATLFPATCMCGRPKRLRRFAHTQTTSYGQLPTQRNSIFRPLLTAAMHTG
jgi:hypothetical protein